MLLPQSQVVVAICNQDRAEVLMAAGLTRRGLSALDEARERSVRTGLRSDGGRRS